ncbi:protein YgfX [Ferrimonas balearica]|uniref:protein YgfX n=1 Tax=Ferrimonas balearica TaxID=44012 RepID=UPI001C99120D|nr:protein YgfX [Ferrimonas balearica]MBY5993494.1 hypothetical protein [Ferrimonas balearica]
MSATASEASGVAARRYHFYPRASRDGRSWVLAGYLLLAATLGLWPAELPLWARWVQGGILVGLGLLAWRHRGPLPARPFSLTEAGQGRWLDSDSDFALSPASRLLPRMALLRWHQDGQRGWHWCHRDSFERADWHRLCRLVLRAQRGDSTVGPGSAAGSG